MSAGDLSEEEIEGIRTGAIADPSVGQVAVLAAAFLAGSAILAWVILRR